MFKISLKKVIAYLLLIVTIFNCTLITFAPEVNASSSQFYNVAKKIHANFRTKNFTYKSTVIKQITKYPYATNNQYTNGTEYITDCSHFVSVSLYKYFPTSSKNSKQRLYMRQNRIIKNSQLVSGDFINIGKCLKKQNFTPTNYFSKKTIKKLSNYFTLVSQKNMKKGDIIVYKRHVEIFSCMKNGKMYVLNCGDTKSINAKNDISKSNHTKSQIKYILRVK